MSISLRPSIFVSGSNVNLGSAWGHPGRVRRLWRQQCLVVLSFLLLLPILKQNANTWSPKSFIFSKIWYWKHISIVETCWILLTPNSILLVVPNMIILAKKVCCLTLHAIDSKGIIHGFNLYKSLIHSIHVTLQILHRYRSNFQTILTNRILLLKTLKMPYSTNLHPESTISKCLFLRRT